MEHIQNLAYELHELLTSSNEFKYLKEMKKEEVWEQLKLE